MLFILLLDTPGAALSLDIDLPSFTQFQKAYRKANIKVLPVKSGAAIG